LYQTLYCYRKKLTILFPFPEELCLEEGKQKQKQRKKEKKDNTGNHNKF
jgi:hypothetical protein